MPTHPHPGKCVVLVVEDEALVRMDAVDIVTGAGFEVIEASNAGEAIRILEQRDDICVVFTDIDLSGSIDGIELARIVRTRWPPVQLIVTSGHVAVMPDQLPAGARFFPKPYRQDDIARTVRELIPGSP